MKLRLLKLYFFSEMRRQHQQQIKQNQPKRKRTKVTKQKHNQPKRNKSPNRGRPTHKHTRKGIKTQFFNRLSLMTWRSRKLFYNFKKL